MTDKNRDVSQIRVGTVVAFPKTTGEVMAAKGYLVIARGQERFTFSSDNGIVINLNQVWWERTGGYIVSQPVADWDVCPDCVGFGVNNKLFVCATCNGTGGVWESEETGHIQCPTCADQASLRTREELPWDGVPENPKEDGFHWLKQKDGGRLIPFEWDGDEEYWLLDDDAGYPDRVAKLFTYHGSNLPPDIQAEKRGDAAGYERRVAEEGGKAVAKVIGHFNTRDPMVIRLDPDYDIPIDTLLYTAPQPDTRAEPVAYVNLERLKWKLSTGDSVCLTFSASPVTDGRPNHQLADPIYTKPQPDTQAETIAELRLSEMHARADAEAAKAREVVLREALRNISENKTSDCPDQQIAYLEKLAWAAEHCRRTARNALAATGDA